MKTIVKNKELFNITNALFEAMENNGENPQEASDLDKFVDLYNNEVKFFSQQDDFGKKMNVIFQILQSIKGYVLKIQNSYYDELLKEIDKTLKIIFDNLKYYEKEGFGKICYNNFYDDTEENKKPKPDILNDIENILKQISDKNKNNERILNNVKKAQKFKEDDYKKIMYKAGEKTYDYFSDKSSSEFIDFINSLDIIANGFYSEQNEPYNLDSFSVIQDIANIKSSIIFYNISKDYFNFEFENEVMGINSDERKKNFVKKTIDKPDEKTNDKPDEKINDKNSEENTFNNSYYPFTIFLNPTEDGDKYYVAKDSEDGTKLDLLTNGTTDYEKVLKQLEKIFSKYKEEKEQEQSRIENEFKINSYIEYCIDVKSRLSELGIYYGIHYIFLTTDGISLDRIPDDSKIEADYNADINELDDDLKQLDDKLEQNNKKYENNEIKEKTYKTNKRIYEKRKKMFDEERKKIEGYYNDLKNRIERLKQGDFIGQKKLSKISEFFGGLLNKKYLDIMGDKLKMNDKDGFTNSSKLYILAFNRNSYISINELLTTDISLKKKYELERRSVPFIFNIPYIQFKVKTKTGDKPICITGLTLYSELFNKVFTKKAFNNLKQIISYLTKRNKGIDW